MNINVSRIKKSIRRIEAMMLAIMITASSLSYTVKATENNTEQDLIVEQEEEPEEGSQGLNNNSNSENNKLEENKTGNNPENGDKNENPSNKDENEESSKNDKSEDSNEDEGEDSKKDGEGEESEKDSESEEDPQIEYSVEADAEGYKIKLVAYEGVFPEGEELSLSATQIEDQEILDEIDSKLSDVCEGEFEQISFDIKVLNAEGEELQPDSSKYNENEDITPIQLTIELAKDEIEGEIEVFHFADDLSSMECLESTVDGDEITVEPEHFSVFTILKETHGPLYYNGLPVPTGYRTYIEWMPNSTAELRRLQKIYVYAKAGEQISFGSSSFLNLSQGEVTKSLADSFGYGVGDAPSKASIAVTLPYTSGVEIMQEDGSGYSIYTSSTNPADVITQIENSTSYGDKNIYLFKKEEITVSNDSSNLSALGTIYNWQQEALGPKNDDNPGGYTPISFKAPKTGVYTFRFFGTQYTEVKVAPKAKKSADFPQKSLNYVGAWDITVTPDYTIKNPIKGRTFTDALFWTIGANISGDHIMDESVYALTKDGFEYKVDFNGMDPFGFVFYTNKRGLLVSSDDHEDGHYRSLARSVKSKRNPLDDLMEMGVHINSTPTTEKDESYFITFEKADSELLIHYTGKSELAHDGSIGTDEESYKNFKFKGLNSTEDGKGTEGYGGYFSFFYDKSNEPSDKILPSTYEIIINFTGNETMENEYGYAHGKNNEVILSNTLVDGTNTIFWNGKDEYGNVVIGNGEGINYNIVSFHVKAGEVHFPLLDVENNPNGIKIEMQNNISGIDKSKIYYDNSDSDVYGKGIGDGKENLGGVLSDSGAMAFDKNTGDFGVIDIWADYRIASPLNNTYAFTLYGLNNTNAFFTAKTEWQYYYTTMDGSKHYDATPAADLPKTSTVLLQYRVIDKNLDQTTEGIGGVNKSIPGWQDNDTGDGKTWHNYSGEVTVSLQKDETHKNELKIKLNPEVTKSFDKNSSAGSGDGAGYDEYKTVKIESYRFELNKNPSTKTAHPYDESEGLCVFKGLPLHPNKPGTSEPDLTKFYQFRVVDINRKNHPSYVTDELFDAIAAVDFNDDTGHVTKDIYLEETLEYEYRGADSFNLEVDQLWNDSGMSPSWVGDHRPKAVRVAILYGVPKYEDTDKDTEFDITTEKGYYGEDVEVVWRKIQQIDYLTIGKNGVVTSKDNKGDLRTLSSLDSSYADAEFAAYFPVWKYMSNGDPYFYKIRPVAYSMDGTNFSPVNVEYDEADAGHMSPKMSLPEFYGEDDDPENAPVNKYHVVFYEEDVEETAKDSTHPEKPVLYPHAVKFTDIPEIAEIELKKTDETDAPLSGKTTSYEIKNNSGKNLMFTLNSEGNYTYAGLDGASGLPEGSTKVIKTSAVDSIVHAKELPLKEYSIKEVNAPEGYQLSPISIDVAMSDYQTDSTTNDHCKLYLCKKVQKDSRIPVPGPGEESGKGGAPDTGEDPGSSPIPKLTPTPSPSPSPSPSLNPDPSSDPTISTKSPSGDVKGKRLPKTGGLIGSLVAALLGAFMIGYGVYLTKSSKKQRNNKD